MNLENIVIPAGLVFAAACLYWLTKDNSNHKVRGGMGIATSFGKLALGWLLYVGWYTFHHDSYSDTSFRSFISTPLAWWILGLIATDIFSHTWKMAKYEFAGRCLYPSVAKELYEGMEFRILDVADESTLGGCMFLIQFTDLPIPPVWYCQGRNAHLYATVRDSLWFKDGYPIAENPASEVVHNGLASEP